MKIAICGLSSSGKSTLAKNISEVFDLELISAGKFFRDIADEMSIPLEELSRIATKEIDEKIDKKTKEYCANKDNFVIEGRLTCFFCKDSFKIYLYAPLEIRVKRGMERDNISYEEAFKKIKERDEEDLRRYREFYGIEDYDKTMRNIANVVINTKEQSIDEMTNISIDKIKEHFHLF